MLTEIEAPDQDTLKEWFGKRNVNIDWMMRINLDAKDGKVEEF